MKRNRRHFFWTILLLLIFPTTAAANVGTPLILGSAFHLLIGNAIIGNIEGLILAKMFKVPKSKAIFVLILANYVSAWIGWYFLTDFLVSLVDITIENVLHWFLTFTGIAFLLTLLMEFPFVWSLIRQREGSLKKAFKGTLLIHGVSYALLIAWFWTLGGTSLLTDLKVTSAEEMVISEPFSLYYIHPDGEQVIRMDLDKAGSTEQVAQVSTHDGNDRLFARERDHLSGYNLFLYSENAETGNTEEKVLSYFSDEAPVDWCISQGHSDTVTGTWMNFGVVPVIGDNSDWEFGTGFWALEGLEGKNKKTGEIFHFSLELPFLLWEMRNATHITGDHVILQLGEDQLCMVHPESRRISLLARGKGVLVARRKDDE